MDAVDDGQKGRLVMFDKFGEFDSVEELNRAAAAQYKEGDEQAIYTIAQENGIDKEDADDFMDGLVAELATVTSAAIGKLKVEAADLKLKGIVADWKDSIVEECMSSQELCTAVRSKRKSLAECMAKLIRFAFENKVQISDKIVKVTKVTHNGKEEALRGPLYLGVPSKADVKRMVREYYLG